MGAGPPPGTVFLVRYGLPLKGPGKRPAEGALDPAGVCAIWALRESGRLPARAAWVSSPEPKATETAQLLTDGGVGIVDELAEQRRETTDHIADFAATVRRAFAAPHEPAPQGWEPLKACRARVITPAPRIVQCHRTRDVRPAGPRPAVPHPRALTTARRPPP